MSSLLIQNGFLTRNKQSNQQDMLIFDGTIVAINDSINLKDVSQYFENIEVLDADEQLVIPGIVDSHLHLLGGGGSKGFHSRIPSLPVTAVLEAGITSCIAMPGIDTISRSLMSLLAEAERFKAEGVKAHTALGGFRWPFETLTDSPLHDLYMVPQILGIKGTYGEPLGTKIDDETLTSVLGDLKWVRLMTGKAAILHLHLSEKPDNPDRLIEALETTEVPPEQLQLTHVNFSQEALDLAMVLAKRGVLIDINPLINPRRIAGAIAPSEAYVLFEQAGIDMKQVSFSSDGNASMPRELTDGTDEAFSYQLDLLQTLRDLETNHGKKFEEVTATITANPASNWRLSGVGSLEAGNAGDAVILDENRRVETVIADGKVRVRKGVAVEPDRYRDPRWIQ